MTLRIGVFFLFIGLVSMWVYFATDFADSPAFELFFAALGMILLGIYLIRKGYSPPESSGRFRLLKRLRDRNRSNQDSKNNGKANT